MFFFSVSSVSISTISIILQDPAPKPLFWGSLLADFQASLHPMCGSLPLLRSQPTWV